MHLVLEDRTIFWQCFCSYILGSLAWWYYCTSLYIKTPWRGSVTRCVCINAHNFDVCGIWFLAVQIQAWARRLVKLIGDVSVCAVMYGIV